jgi:predicted O-linked N-acetylglucosamine transferase (SPINDLY family)
VWWSGYTGTMSATHADVVVADAYLKVLLLLL